MTQWWIEHKDKEPFQDSKSEDCAKELRTIQSFWCIREGGKGKLKRQWFFGPESEHKMKHHGRNLLESVSSLQQKVDVPLVYSSSVNILSTWLF